MAHYKSFLKIPPYENSDTFSQEELQNSKNENKEKCFPNINQNLVFCKLFYFFYSSAMGSLWPYLPLYYRQLFLSPRQVGAIVASRNLVQFLFVPLWCVLAEKYRCHKTFILFALFFWFSSTISILFVPKDKPKACLRMNNVSQMQALTTKKWFDFSTLRDQKVFVLRRTVQNEEEEVSADYYSSFVILNSSFDVSTTYAQYDSEKHLSDSSNVFILLLLVTIIGVSFASPAQVLADIYTFKKLKQHGQSFAQQVLWAAVGSSVFSFTVGSFVSFTSIQNQCTKEKNINYSPCFFFFGFFIIMAFFAATQFRTKSVIEKVDLDETIATFWQSVKTINDVHLASLVVVTFFCGFGNGFISTFLFWHLREMGGLQILLAFVSLINSIAEVMFYIIAERLMGYVGHFRLIYIGLLFFSARFFYYSFLRQPWLVLPIEITHGMTSAAIRSSLISYIRQEGATGYILHGLFSGIQSGLGFSIGGLVGGFMVHEYGHSLTFLIFGELSILTLLCFVLVNNIWPRTKHDIKKTYSEDNKTLTDLYNTSRSNTSFNKSPFMNALTSEKKPG
ncbi:major facilitator superfamily domain-containing protein 6 [Hydra vulgaris]|uniref:major facilitator superfamily domain-containing protein 6 n=1 Tax=Hydra vulgaris TaxID=6087 RepID=UPI001F5E85C5|nr:major facilitator superfamily domain-containing protein 6 [Hydra vulgaris]